MDKNAISQMLNGVDKYPMHMPGHKRNQALLQSDFPYHRDITEIVGSDNLHHMSGVILQECRRAAHLWGAKGAYFLVGGSTCGILAAIRAYAGHDVPVVVARNSHKSVYNGIEMCRLTPTYLYPMIDPHSGICGSITPDQVEKALHNAPGAKLVIVTSPTYEGVISDIAGIARVAHAHGAKLLVDAAHGAHLGLGEFPAHPVTLGADVAICSLHKTLPAPTQTAIALIGQDCPDPGVLASQLAVFQTSSPSYVLMEESARCVAMLKAHGDALMCAWQQRLFSFSQKAAKMQHLRLLYREDYPECVWGYDPGKLVISTRGTILTGYALAEILRNRYAIEVEMAAGDYIIAMTSLADSDEGLSRFACALCEIDCQLQVCKQKANAAFPQAQTVLAPWQALDLVTEQVIPSLAKDRVAGEYVWAYPPGIPLVVPGERLGEAVLAALASMQQSGAELESTSGTLPHTIRVIKEHL